MAKIYEYAPGEHPAGFYGFRVAGTLGCSAVRAQHYYSAKEHGYELALKLAKNKKIELDKVSAHIARADHIFTKSRKTRPWVLSSAFWLGVDMPGTSKSGKECFFKFVVGTRQVVNAADKSFYFTSTEQLPTAFKAAVRYMKMKFNLSNTEIESLTSRAPSIHACIDLLLASKEIKADDVLHITNRYTRPEPAKLSGLPTLAAFQKADAVIKSEKLPVYLYFKHLEIFWRISPEKVYHKSYCYEEYGGLAKALAAAKKQLETYQSVERALKFSEQNDSNSPAKSVRLHRQGERLCYRVLFNGKYHGFFHFNDATDIADFQLHAYRTALYISYGLSCGTLTELEIKKLPDWRRHRLYVDGSPRVAFAPEGSEATLTFEEVKAAVEEMLRPLTGN